MGKIKSGGSSAGSKKKYSEKELKFVNRVYERCNRYSDAEVDSQVLALKSIIEYIKYRKNAGASLEDIKEEVLRYVFNVIVHINQPDLASFYRLRTYEYIDGIDLVPYINTIINKKINIMEFYEKHEFDLSPHLNTNIVIEICGLLTDMVDKIQYSQNDEILYLREKIVNNELTLSDVELVNKWILRYCNELKIGRATEWEKMKKNPEALRKMFIKKLDSIFDVTEVQLENAQTKANKSNNVSNEDNRLAAIIESQGDPYSIAENISGVTNSQYTKRTVTLKPFKGNPYISNDAENNFMIYVYETMQKFKEHGTEEQFDIACENIYTIAETSENEKIRPLRDKNIKMMHDLFTSGLVYQRNSLSVKEDLSKRIAILIDFFRANGDLDRFCETNNSRLKAVWLPEMQIETQDLYDKFVSGKTDIQDLIYMRDDEEAWEFYEKCYKNTPMGISSSEAIIAMSSFYMNRLAKESLPYGRARYILDQKGLIEHIYDNPEATYEDLGLDDKQLRLYMAMGDELQNLMCKMYVDKLPNGANFKREEWLDDLRKIIFPAIKNVYENYFEKQGFDFDLENDMRNVIYNSVVPEYIYGLKTFSVKSLMYTALTDKKKNILNWGYVPEDENEDNNMALIGFDIKGLSMPVFVHLKKDDLEFFLNQVQGNTLIPIYEGADDMFNYKLKKRFTTQILYPVSKDERAKLKKVKGVVTDDRLYQHIRWLYSPTKGSVTPFTDNHMPGSRAYDLKTGKIIKIKKEDKEHDMPDDDSKPSKNQKGKKDKKKKQKQGGPGTSGTSKKHGAPGDNGSR